MASENEIIEKIKEFKEQKNPNFEKYMNFYKEKFPDFYNSKLKIYETFDFNSKINISEKKPSTEESNKEKDDVFTDSKVLTNQPIFNINEGKKETNGHTTNGFNHNGDNHEHIIVPVAKKSKKKIILIVTLVLIIIGAAIGAYLLLI
jgi:hypothetical protein